jgi:hypothetical protein
MNFTRAQGIPNYNTGLGGGKDGRVGERLVACVLSSVSRLPVCEVWVCHARSRMHVHGFKFLLYLNPLPAPRLSAPLPRLCVCVPLCLQSCRYFAMGQCTKGAACPFTHDGQGAGAGAGAVFGGAAASGMGASAAPTGRLPQHSIFAGACECNVMNLMVKAPSMFRMVFVATALTHMVVAMSRCLFLSYA